MRNRISHEGIVVKVEGRKVTVRFVQSSACSGCHAKHLCVSSESKERTIVADSFGVPYSVGEQVIISISDRLAGKAMFFAFGLPIILVLVALFPMVSWLGEGYTCLSLLALLAIYYTVFYLNRDRLDTEVAFDLSRKL